MTIIKDPALEPYYIGKDNYCYTVYEVVTPDEENARTKGKGKVYEKPLGHFSGFGAALERVAKAQVDHKESYSSIKDYLESWNNLKQQISKLTDLGI